jgi:hypothetical protein
MSGAKEQATGKCTPNRRSIPLGGTTLAARGWTIVDMRRDWRKVFAFER